MNTATRSYRTGAAYARTEAILAGRPQRLRRFVSKSKSASGTEAEPANVRQLKSDSSSLNETIRLAQQGDAVAFESIYRLHSRRVYALCLRMLGDPVEAEDLTQEAFMQLFRKIHTFRGESAFSSWLHRLTANVVLMRFRKKRPVATSLDEVVRTDEENEMPRKEIGAIDLRLSGLFDRVNLQAAIEQLPEGYRLMFILHDVHGYEHNEIAGILGCSVGNSKSQLHKARKRLRELLHRVQHYRTHQSREAACGSLAMAASY
jgi:RNA polymerase sigma-70 factor (ECF subfamily)